MRLLTLGEVVELHERLLEVFLVLNGFEIDATVDDQEQTILAVASGQMDRDGLSLWLKARLVPLR